MVSLTAELIAGEYSKLGLTTSDQGVTCGWMGVPLSSRYEGRSILYKMSPKSKLQI